jgi:hypothetical protein
MNKMIVPAAFALALASSPVFAQSMTEQYDRTGDHMVSYGGTAPVAPTKVHAARQSKRHHAAATLSVPTDRTGDHMLYYGPVAQ